MQGLSFMTSGIDEKHPGRPPTLEREQILAAAAEIPLKDFSVRAVAERLKVSPQSIYYYFDNKTNLLGAMASEALLALPDVEVGDWRGYFRQSLLGYRAWVMAAESPARLPEITGRIGRLGDGPNEQLLIRMETFVSVFVNAGLSPQQAVEVWNLGATLVVRSVANRMDDGAVSEQWSGLKGDVEALGAARFPRLSAALSEDPPPMDEVFGRIVDVAIEGVAAAYGID